MYLCRFVFSGALRFPPLIFFYFRNCSKPFRQAERLPFYDNDDAIVKFLDTDQKLIENGEPGFYEWFVWEQGKGLVEYGSGFGAEGDILYLTNIKVQ